MQAVLFVLACTIGASKPVFGQGYQPLPQSAPAFDPAFEAGPSAQFQDLISAVINNTPGVSYSGGSSLVEGGTGSLLSQVVDQTNLQNSEGFALDQVLAATEGSAALDIGATAALGTLGLPIMAGAAVAGTAYCLTAGCDISAIFNAGAAALSGNAPGAMPQGMSFSPNNYWDILDDDGTYIRANDICAAASAWIAYNQSGLANENILTYTNNPKCDDSNNQSWFMIEHCDSGNNSCGYNNFEESWPFTPYNASSTSPSLPACPFGDYSLGPSGQGSCFPYTPPSAPPQYVDPLNFPKQLPPQAMNEPISPQLLADIITAILNAVPPTSPAPTAPVPVPTPQVQVPPQVVTQVENQMGYTPTLGDAFMPWSPGATVQPPASSPGPDTVPLTPLVPQSAGAAPGGNASPSGSSSGSEPPRPPPCGNLILGEPACGVVVQATAPSSTIGSQTVPSITAFLATLGITGGGGSGGPISTGFTPFPSLFSLGSTPVVPCPVGSVDTGLLGTVTTASWCTMAEDAQPALSATLPPLYLFLGALMIVGA